MKSSPFCRKVFYSFFLLVCVLLYFSSASSSVASTNSSLRFSEVVHEKDRIVDVSGSLARNAGLPMRVRTVAENRIGNILGGDKTSRLPVVRAVAENGISNILGGDGISPIAGVRAVAENRIGGILGGEGTSRVAGVRAAVAENGFSGILTGKMISHEHDVIVDLLPGRSDVGSNSSFSVKHDYVSDLQNFSSPSLMEDALWGSGLFEDKVGKAGSMVVLSKREELVNSNEKEVERYLVSHGYPSLSAIRIAQSTEEFTVMPELPARENGSTIQEYVSKIFDEFQDACISQDMKDTLLFPPVCVPPKNEHLADSAWPAPHRMSYGQGSSPLPGPDGSYWLTHDFLSHTLIANNPINLLYTKDNRYMWGSSWTSVFKVDRSQSRLRLVDYVLKPMDTVLTDKFHGAYSILTEDGMFVIANGNKLEVYYDTPEYNGQRIMKHPVGYDMSSDTGTNENEVIRALCLLYDGMLVWVSNQGRIGVLSRDIENGFKKSLHWMKLADDDEDISNNIACDEEGGIYIVSSKLMYKVIWDGINLRFTWSADYNKHNHSDEAISTFQGETRRLKIRRNSVEGSSDANLSVRLGEGSGSTPSLMGDKERGRYVVITDAASVMNVVIFDAENGEIRDTHPITFGDPETKLSLSEQSILVNGWRLVVVNNTPRSYLMNGPLFLGGNMRLGGGSSQGAFISDTIRSAWPVIVGDSPKGVEQLMFNPYTGKLKTTWVNRIISIPNGIPTMSMEKGIMYGIGKRGPFGISAGAFRGMWTLEGIDWWTGKQKFYYNLGMGPWTNSIYAATEIGPDEEIVTGTAVGIVRVRKLERILDNIPLSLFLPLASTNADPTTNSDLTINPDPTTDLIPSSAQLAVQPQLKRC